MVKIVLLTYRLFTNRSAAVSPGNVHKAPQGNAVSGPNALIDSANCLIRSEGPMISAIGIRDLVVVATEHAVLVVPLSESQRVLEALALLADGKSRQTGGLAVGFPFGP